MDLFSHAAQHEAVSSPFTIKRGIPIPTSREKIVRLAWARPVLRFGDMDVGDCFDVWPQDCGGVDIIRVQNYVSGAAASFRANDATGRSFTTRQIQGQFVRCWRVK